MKRHVFIILVCMLFPLAAWAQAVVERSTEIVRIGTNEYYMHHVKQGETLYGLSKAYQVTVEEITAKNPEVAEGLQTGMVIGIPVVTHDGDTDTLEAVDDEPAKGRIHRVAQGETLFDIAKRYGIDLACFKELNPGLTNTPAAGTVIQVPDIRNDEEYLVHAVEDGGRTSVLIRNWAVDESAFRTLNPAVGSRVFKGQQVLIPIERVVYVEPETVNLDEKNVTPETVEEPEAYFSPIDEEPELTCVMSPENASKTYKVALLIPLYLNEVKNISVSRESIEKDRKAKSLSFIQFYEGFMLAVDSLQSSCGLNLELTVVDVTENVNTAQEALRQLRGKDLDVIVGPFFSKSFEAVQAYAKENEILIINPLSNREAIVEGNPYVVKLKPSVKGQLGQLSRLVRQEYADSKVFIISQSKLSSADSLYLDELERLMHQSVNPEVMVTAESFLKYAANEGRRLKMGSRIPSTIEENGRIFATSDLKNGSVTEARFENPVRRFVYSAGLKSFNNELSRVRNNLVIAYGNDNVFATQLLNNLNKSADRCPITLLTVSDWSSLDKLSVENLLKMNAIYFGDCFVDYNSLEVNQFVMRFRQKYAVEPSEYAFRGFDAAWYFLNALMGYGHDLKDCLPGYEPALLSNPVHLVRKGKEHGMENSHWSIYQYNRESIELKPMMIYNYENQIER